VMTRFDWGTFARDGAVLHVNRGLGTCGQPLRIGAPAEISVLELATSGSRGQGRPSTANTSATSCTPGAPLATMR
jgi:hypothetical protein